MLKKLFVTPEYITANEIKKIRKQLGLTQKEFALLINCSKSMWSDGRQVVSLLWDQLYYC